MLICSLRPALTRFVQGFPGRKRGGFDFVPVGATEPCGSVIEPRHLLKCSVRPVVTLGVPQNAAPPGSGHWDVSQLSPPEEAMTGVLPY
jgi:hypothetical protein